ncbi:SIR2 family protein [Exiguobacterium chiriqhucha]
MVTYNFDDLIEYNLEKRKVINYRSVFQEADMPSKNELGIYHVHGFFA